MSDPTTRPSSAPLGPAADEPGKDVVYRPLSLLALVGFGVAALYTAVVVLGGAIAFFLGDPWLMKGWTALFPVAAVALSAMALVYIQRSEGTLAGEKLARWGLLLSLVVGLGYWSYVGATYFAIGREADRNARSFLEKLTKTADDRQQLISAFLMTLPPSERPAEDAKVRDQVEARFNAGEMSRAGGGPFTTFVQTQSVRVLALGGADTKIESLGVDDWKYVAGSYQVKLLYKVETPQLAFAMEVTVLGQEGKGSEGRQWFVMWNQVGMRSDPKPVMSPQGANELNAVKTSRDYLSNTWLRALQDGKVLEAYLATLPEGDRDATRKAADAETAALGLLLSDGLGGGALPNAAPATALARVALLADASPKQVVALPALGAFLDGSLVRADPGVFWAPESMRADIIEHVRRSFRQQDSQLIALLTPEMKVQFPSMHVSGDRYVIENDVMTRIPLDTPRYMIEARIVMDCDAKEAQAGEVKNWRVLKLELINGRLAPFPATKPDGSPTMPKPLR
jgi:hypothetical protein